VGAARDGGGGAEGLRWMRLVSPIRLLGTGGLRAAAEDDPDHDRALATEERSLPLGFGCKQEWRGSEAGY
jgi:hypothetical protein